MSASSGEAAIRSALPLADFSDIDACLDESPERLKAAVLAVRPADLGRDLSRRTREQARRLLDAADPRRASAIVRAAHPTVAANVLATCDLPHVAHILDFLPTDHKVAILGAMDEQERARIEGALEPPERERVERILAYDERAVARLMTPKVWAAEREGRVASALERLRAEQSEIEVAQNCYVVDNGKLVGVVPLRVVAVADPALKLEAIMTPDPIALREDADRADAAEIIRTHDFLSLPVVDADARLVGAVRVDDLLDAALSQAGAGLLNQGGVSGTLAARLPYFQTSLRQVVRSRVTWLVLLFVAETATGSVLRHFEDELAKVVALSFFIPLLIGTGGNAGSQTVSTIIRALALAEVRLRDAWRILAKEAISGLAVGLLLGVIAFGRALLWGVGSDLALCVGVTVLAVCLWANTVGALVPLAAQRAGVDPTVISGPLITTLVDASGLFIYLTIAHLMIAQLH